MSLFCPLTHDQLSVSMNEPLKKLIDKCRKSMCSFVDSDHDSDYLPANCMLLVVAMLDSGGKNDRGRAAIAEAEGEE